MASDGTGMSLKKVQLWEGAADMSVPERMIDVSDIRPVPDNQEVYMDSSNGQAVVIEIVEPVSPPEGESFALFAFQDLADVSGASVKELNTQIPDSVAIPGLTDIDFIEMVSGLHTTSHAGSQAQHNLHIMLAVIRLHGANADIMITLSTPEEAVNAAPPLNSGASMNSANDAAQLFRAMVESLQFHDKSLLS